MSGAFLFFSKTVFMHFLQEQAAIILPENGLEAKLRQAKAAQRPLTIKLGFDPTAPDLHLGHAVVLKRLKQFQDEGHNITIVVGSFTARIGDPTGKNKARQPLSAEDVTRNAQTYIDQLSRILDVSRTTVVFNGDWLEALSSSDMIQLLSRVTVAQLLQRNDFSNRYTGHIPIALHELVYPVLQAYDSVQLQCDVEMGGTDQLFNCALGRQLQESYGLSPQVVLCMPLLRGTDGKEKMSKSLHNTIGLTDTPEEMFGKTLSIPDSLIPEFIALTTDLSPAAQQAWLDRLEQGENPMQIKKLIAANIITQYHSAAAAMAAARFFEQQVQQRDTAFKVHQPVPLASLPAVEGPMPLLSLCGLLQPDATRSVLRRLITGGGVDVNGARTTDPYSRVPLEHGTRLRIGKRSLFELTGA